MTADDINDASKDIAARAGTAASDAAEAGVDAASQAVDRTRGAAGDLAKSAADVAKARLSELGDQMPGSAGEAIEVGKRAYMQGSEQIGRRVARQPIEALMLACAIGYLVGWAANRS